MNKTTTPTPKTKTKSIRISRGLARTTAGFTAQP